MKPDRHRPLVQVHVNVNVVIDGETEAVTSEYLTPIGRPDRLGSGTIIIDVPRSSTGSAQAWPNSLGQYFICASGRLTAAAPTVRARVYPGILTTPPSVPCDATSDSNCIITNPGSSGEFPWLFDRTPVFQLLPLPGFALSGPNPYTVVVWTTFNNDANPTNAMRSFNAVAALGTDCDSARTIGDPLMAQRHLAVAGQSAGASVLPHLIGHLRRKTGRFARLPKRIELHWCCSQQGWTWKSDADEFGSFTVVPYRNWYLLQTTVTNPPLIPANAGGSTKPLQLAFSGTADSSGESGTFTLEINEGD